ncbi:MAG: pyridoxamine 5'-phosphate oxidase family protein, partial [Bacteroidota bacterium]
RSVVLFGKGRWVLDPAEQERGLRALTEQMLPGRYEESRAPNAAEMKVTAVIAFDIEEASAKIRSAPPKDDPADEDAAVWAGVVPLKISAGMPIKDDITSASVAMPDSVKTYISR